MYGPRLFSLCAQMRDLIMVSERFNKEAKRLFWILSQRHKNGKAPFTINHKIYNAFYLDCCLINFQENICELNIYFILLFGCKIYYSIIFLKFKMFFIGRACFAAAIKDKGHHWREVSCTVNNVSLKNIGWQIKWFGAFQSYQST